MLRTHTCGELNKEHADQTVTICGWVDRVRDLGQGKFILIRDRYGRTQSVVNPDSPPEVLKVVEDLHHEYVVSITGVVRLRPTGQENPDMKTGEIELQATSVEILNECKTPPDDSRDTHYVLMV